MNIYKLDYLCNNIHQSYLRLVDVLVGEFLGFNLDNNGVLQANFKICLEKGFQGNIVLKEGESFCWPGVDPDGDVQGEFKITLVKTKADKEDVHTLYNGVEVPRLGFGTWLIGNEKAKEVVKNAINLGYIHIDSAQAYGNEEGIGFALKKTMFKREDIFITSKVEAEIKDYESAKKSIEESLRKLDTDYIDLMLIHCPMPWDQYKREGGYRYQKENLEVWKALEEAYEAGKLRAIGVSNFNIDDLLNIMAYAKIRPMVNQIPLLLGDVDKELVSFCNEHNIMVESYSPLAHGHLIHDKNKELMHEEVIKNNPALAKYTWSQLLLSYASTYADIILPKASSKDHMLEDMNYLLSLDQDTVHLLEKLHQELGTPFVFEE